MTREQKAKAYDEALERARKIHNETEFDYEKGMMEEIFPSLKESEDGGTIMSKEKEFHNHRIAFYINKDNSIVFIKKGQSHIEYFNEIGHSEYINFVIRGYILDDHVMFYIGNDFEIPMNLTIKTILKLVSSINKSSIKWVGLGCIIGKVGEEWGPKISIKINTTI